MFVTLADRKGDALLTPRGSWRRLWRDRRAFSVPPCPRDDAVRSRCADQPRRPRRGCVLHASGWCRRRRSILGPPGHWARRLALPPIARHVIGNGCFSFVRMHLAEAGRPQFYLKRGGENDLTAAVESNGPSKTYSCMPPGDQNQATSSGTTARSALRDQVRCGLTPAGSPGNGRRADLTERTDARPARLKRAGRRRPRRAQRHPRTCQAMAGRR